MKTPIEILFEVFDPSPQDCTTPEQDLQLAITLNPSLDRIKLAMEEYAKQFKPICTLCHEVGCDGYRHFYA